MPSSSPFLDKLVSRIDRLGTTGLQDQVLSLARRRGLLESILQSVQEGVIVVSSDGAVTYANHAAEELLGFEFQRLRGHPVERYLPDIDWAALARRDEDSWKRMTTIEVELLRPKRRIVSLYAFPLEADDGESADPGVVAILRDVTREREDAATVLESERMDAIRVLAASLAHEIGNPLNALGIHLQLLRRAVKNLPEGESRDELADLARIAGDEISRLDLILSKFLRALRPSAPDLAPCDVLQILGDSLKVMKGDIESHRISVSIDHPLSLPKISGDAEQLKQVFFNLVKNAVQAMGDGGALSISLSADDRDLTVSFRDTGSGIAADDLGRLFKTFHTGKADGHGLGLAIVDRIVRDHGGRIDVSSRPGEGARFTLSFPLADRIARRIQPPSQKTTHP